MSESIVAYRHVAASDEFREIERMRSKEGMMKHGLSAMRNGAEMNIGKVWSINKLHE